MNSSPEAGSFVEVTTMKSEQTITQKGTVLPRGELFASGILVLKLENGYNVGIAQKTITKT